MSMEYMLAVDKSYIKRIWWWWWAHL